MADIKQRHHAGQILKTEKRMGTEIVSDTGSQPEAIAQSKILEASFEQIAVMVEQEMTPEFDTDLHEFSKDPYSPGFLNPPEDDDFYDFSEYDEDDPRQDPDRRYAGESFQNNNDFEAMEAATSITPKDDIIFDPFGGLSIPLDELLFRFYGHSMVHHKQKKSALFNRIQIKAEFLRKIGEILLEKVGQIILSNETDLTKIKLPSLTQKEFMKPLGLDKHRSSHLLNHYIETPNWGILHLSLFFEGDQWSDAITEIKELLISEDLSNPYKNDILFNILKESASKEYQDTQQYRIILKKWGIPLAKPRRDIYECVKKWQQDNSHQQIKVSDIPRIFETLVKNYGLFNNIQTKPCLESQYVPFIEKRITAVLESLGVHVQKEE